MRAKRAFDLTAAGAGLVILSPVMVALACLIKLDSKGPVFYRGTRTGQFGKPFRIFKFRTMVADAEQRGGPSTALNDPRLTRLGAFLRKYKLDELPQLLNIMKGEMSVVGPRPQVEKYTAAYTAREKAILDVRPGLTDYASIEFMDLDRILGTENVDEKYAREIEPRKNELRIKYVHDNSLSTDLRIIGRTLAQMTGIRRRWNTDG